MCFYEAIWHGEGIGDGGALEEALRSYFIVNPEKTISYPSTGKELQHEVEVVILIGKNGNRIPESDTLSYVSGITLGLDLTLRDVQNKLKKFDKIDYKLYKGEFEQTQIQSASQKPQ